MTHTPKPEDVAVGKRIRDLRVSKALSQTIVGKRLGISFQQVQKYETGANRISASSLAAMARVLEVPVSYFFIGLTDLEAASVPSTPDELELLENFRATQPHARQSILRIAQETAQISA